MSFDLDEMKCGSGPRLGARLERVHGVCSGAGVGGGASAGSVAVWVGQRRARRRLIIHARFDLRDSFVRQRACRDTLLDATEQELADRFNRP